jgi:hypothetical protein
MKKYLQSSQGFSTRFEDFTTKQDAIELTDADLDVVCGGSGPGDEGPEEVRLWSLQRPIIHVQR